MREPDNESGAERPASLWDALLYDAVDSLQTLQVHTPADSFMARFKGKSAKEDVAEFRRAFTTQLKTRAKNKRVFRGTSNAFFIFGPPNTAVPWSFRYGDVDVDVNVRTMRVTVSPERD